MMVQKELWEGLPEEEVYLPRDQWKPFDPHLLAEGKFYEEGSEITITILSNIVIILLLSSSYINVDIFLASHDLIMMA